MEEEEIRPVAANGNEGAPVAVAEPVIRNVVELERRRLMHQRVMENRRRAIRARREMGQNEAMIDPVAGAVHQIRNNGPFHVVMHGVAPPRDPHPPAMQEPPPLVFDLPDEWERPPGPVLVGEGRVNRDGQERMILSLVQRCNKTVTSDNHRELMPEASQNRQRVIGETPAHVIQFRDLQTPKIGGVGDVREGQVENMEEIEDVESLLRPLRNYISAKQKFGSRLDSVFSVFIGRTEAQTLGYFLQVDSDFLQKISEILKDASISVLVRIDGIPPDQLLRGGARQARHLVHPYYPNNQQAELYFKTANENGIKVSDLLVSDPPGLIQLRRAARRGCSITVSYPRPPQNTQSQNINFSWLINVECSNDTFSSTQNQVREDANLILQNIYNLEDSSKDLTVVVAGGGEIKCHKNILMAQSPSFHSMLSPDYDMIEVQTGRIEMFENSEEGVRQFIRFLYGYEIPVDSITPDVAFEVFQLANKYEVATLERFMKAFLSRQGMSWFTVDTIMELYVYARNIESLEVLKAHALAELSTISDEAIKSSDYFKSLETDDAMDLLFKLLEWNKND